MTQPPALASILARLQSAYGPPPPPVSTDPFELILWEQVAYLVDDAHRQRAFDLLAERIGLRPEQLASAPSKAFAEVVATGGGIARAKRAQRLRESALRVLDHWDGGLAGVLALPAKRALRELQKFAVIGRPGAEKILLLTRTQPLLALESNGLRVLLRLGYGSEGKSYAASYQNVREATSGQLEGDFDALIALHLLLRRHGKERCRNSKPDCEGCPLSTACRFFGT